MSVEDAALGFIRVANESMCRPIRALTQAKGHDTSKHVLSCFGGAGGQHACAIARSLGMSRVYVHKYAGILSAYGMALADVVHEKQIPCSLTVFEGLKSRGFDEQRIELELYLNMKYEGTESAIMLQLPNMKRNLGFLLQDHNILVEDVRVRGIGKTDVYIEKDLEECGPNSIHPIHEEIIPIYFDGGFMDSKVFLFKNLLRGQELKGPSLIIDDLSTILIEPNCVGHIDKKGNLDITIGESIASSRIGTQLDSIQLSIFSHRFMSIAEQMGRILQRTSISTNIKERLDFSCALFGPDGGLVSNAPHIPVHLGAMQDTVKYQIKVANFRPGDLSHQLFIPEMEEPVFFTANRGHHADIGGSTPGSMPPHSKFLIEEGAQFMSFKLVQNGRFNKKELIEKFKEPGKYPNCTGSRCLSDNISDLKAQIAANQKGILLVQELIAYYGLDVVQSYMGYIQSNAELSVRDTLKNIASKFLSKEKKKTGLVELKSEDFMDDGSCINLSITINSENGSAVFDFTGTGHQVWGNINTPKAVCYSAVIYSLRCLVGHDIPLNQGCLKPINIIIPEGSLLNPSDDAAVVGGNVLTSQRIVDVILSAFEAAANSQGCCNNVTFGDQHFGYYETVAGGSGAGPTWNGTSGIHFSLARGTGGLGQYNGGDGVLRAIKFRKDLTLSILTERRVFSPNGICGGSNGSPGVNILVRVKAGDVFVMKTPGGGGYGEREESFEEASPKKINARSTKLRWPSTRCDNRICSFTKSLSSNLKHAQTKFQNSGECVSKLTKECENKEILVPLTGSMYVPGRIVDPEKVLVDVGTGYYVEKDIESAKEYFDKKVKYVTVQMENVQMIGNEKSKVKEAVMEVMQSKVQAELAQQQAPAAVAAK
ncbi:OPLAH [Lepeophtheirus salmonis]|uniref:OPLAH n=1 Tax=Lepeophtheirus salmonis TaxID=72036 RepID=A0A7R8H252_LEPSM|nr:OPLAH [Lepeophtheirus salmonis]CAF2807543.1 OPLAH [Lepeophtheirus salmonis]